MSEVHYITRLYNLAGRRKPLKTPGHPFYGNCAISCQEPRKLPNALVSRESNLNSFKVTLGRLLAGASDRTDSAELPWGHGCHHQLA
jgi:hypothetical protein